jgi:PAS domain S-box-containing protein
MSSKKSVALPSEYDTLYLGIGLYDPSSGDILDANERLERILGYPLDTLRRLSVDTYTANTYPQSASEFRDRLRASADGDPQRFIWRAKRADGELVWLQLHVSQQQFSERDCVIVEVRDITDHYESRHRAELFWRILRHNLRNEAAIILGYADQIATHGRVEGIAESIAAIRSRGENLGSMAESVKEIERAITDARAEHVRQPALATVREVAARTRAEYPAAEISVEEREEMWIEVNDAFGYAVRHAVENAIVHSTERAPTVEITVGTSPNTGRVEIRIKDANPTIPTEEIEALFAPAESTNTSHGSGIGLFVMKWCIESLGGEVMFDTRTPQGNVVHLYLPSKRAPDTVDNGAPT